MPFFTTSTHAAFHRVNVEQRNKLKQLTQGPDETKGWTGETLAKLYFECCRTREERAIPRLSRLLKVRDDMSSVYVAWPDYSSHLGQSEGTSQSH